MNFTIVLSLVLSLFIPIIIGYIIRKTNMVSETFGKELSSLIFNVLGPCLVLKAMRYDFTFETLKKSGVLVIISLFIITVSYFIGFYVARLLSKDFNTRVIIEFAVSCSNFGFMGIPIMFALFGQEGAFFASIFNLAYFIYANGVAIILVQRKSASTSITAFLKTIFNPQTIAVLLGFFLFAFSIKLPTFINDTVDWFANSSVPISMLLGGIVLANSKLDRLLLDWHIYIICALRLIVLPLTIFYILKYLGFSGIMLKVPVLINAMPVANNAIIISEKFNKNSIFAAKCVAISTFLAIFTIPLIYVFIS